MSTITTHPTKACGAEHASEPLKPLTIPRREPTAADVEIDILFCGVCHSDLHQVKSQWAGTMYPCVPGHEIVGRVSRVGAKVTKHKVGDVVGVGCMVDSCRACSECKEGLEQYCQQFPTFTYNGVDKHLSTPQKQIHTWGGYSKKIVVDEHFVVKMPTNLDLAASAPLLCAGITTYSPLKHWGVGRGSKVGVVGLGGLGHMAVKLSHAMGAQTFVFTTSPDKVADAKRLGADDAIISKDEAQMGKHAVSFDFIIDTVGNSHNLDPYINMLKRDGTLCLVGAPEHPHPSPTVFNMLLKRRSMAGSAIGGIAETQEMLDFCGKHGIVSDIEKIKMSYINEAYERMVKSDVKYRFVIDMATL
jgi:uncharacterized zinc-type alcohol dehydrogenase-like protein